jgi:hypothetical protein
MASPKGADGKREAGEFSKKNQGKKQEFAAGRRNSIA